MVAAALANFIFSGWQDLDTRMDCDHLKTHMPRYFFNLTNDIRTVVDTDGVQLRASRLASRGSGNGREFRKQRYRVAKKLMKS